MELKVFDMEQMSALRRPRGRRHGAPPSPTSRRASRSVEQFFTRLVHPPSRDNPRFYAGKDVGFGDKSVKGRRCRCCRR